MKFFLKGILEDFRQIIVHFKKIHDWQFEYLTLYNLQKDFSSFIFEYECYQEGLFSDRYLEPKEKLKRKKARLRILSSKMYKKCVYILENIDTFLVKTL